MHTVGAAAVDHGVDLHGSDLPVIEVHRAGELVAAFRHVPVTEDLDGADDPVIAAGIVVDAGVQEFHSTPAEAVSRLVAHRILADADCLLDGEAAGRGIGKAVRTAIGAAPDEVEGIAFGSVPGIFNADDGDAAVARIADQLLPAAAIDALKAELGGVAGQGRAALEAAPLRGLARNISDDSLIAADIDLGDSVNHHFDGALAAIGTATADHGGPAFEHLRG